MQYKDYYAILGVERKASQDDIKHAYRRLARKYHPDVSKEKNAEEQFKNVQEAYEVLKDAEKRAAYDQLGNQWKAGQEFRPPPDWQHGRTRSYSSDQADFAESDLGGFSDFFTHLFNRAGSSREGFQGFKQRGSDQRAKIQISLEEAFHGATKTFQMQMPEIDASGQMHATLRTIKVTIPAGVTQGQQLRLTGQGGAGIGGPAGDLYLEIDIQAHPRFSLQNKDIFMTLPITPWESALGAQIKVPTLGGAIELKVSPGSHAGQKLRLKGRGMPSKPISGDQYVILQIETPPAHSEEQRKFYENMAHVMPFNPRKDWMI